MRDNRIFLQTALAMVVLMVLGYLLGWHTIRRTEASLQESLMNRARMAQDTLRTLTLTVISSRATAEESPVDLHIRMLLNILASADGDIRLAYLITRNPGGECTIIHSKLSADIGENATAVLRVSPSDNLCRILDIGNETIEEHPDPQGNVHVMAGVPIHDPHSGKVIAAIAIEENKKNWKPVMVRAALPAGALTLACIGILSTAAVITAGRSRQGRKPARQNGWTKPLATASVGLALTAYIAWTIHQDDRHLCNTAFEKLAASTSHEIADRFFYLHHIELEGLARFIENSQEVTDSGFHRYTEYLVRDPTVQAWEWIPVIPAGDRESFEESMRKEGVIPFDIWEKDPHGNSVPAGKRQIYYPVTRIAPLADNEKALGYDLGSEPIRRMALEEAIRTSQTTVSYPIKLIQETGTQKGMLIYRPVFDRERSDRLRGISLAVLRMRALLNSVSRDKSILFDLSLIHGLGMKESLALDWESDSPPVGGPSRTRFIPAFGKIFALTAYPDSLFYRQHPTRAGLFAALIGLILTAALTGVVSLVGRRQEELEKLIAIRTAELQESETNFRSFFETIPDPILVGTEDGRILFVNKAATLKLGYTAEAFSFMQLQDLYPAERREEAGTFFTAMLQGERENSPLPLCTKAGDPMPVETRIWLGKWSGTNCTFVFSKDISAEQEAQQRFESLFHNNPALMSLSELPDGRFVDVNNAFLTELGYSRDDIVGKTPGELPLFPDPDILAGGRLGRSEIKVQARDGSFHDCLVSTDVLTIHERRYFLTVMSDITERKRMEEKIARTNERMRMAADSAGIGIWDMLFLENRLIWDDWMFRLYGINPDDFKGNFDSWRQRVHPDDLEDATHLMVLALHGNSNFDTEFRIVRPDGEIRYLKAHARVTRDEYGQPLRMTGVNYDITEQRLSQETLQQRESYLSAIIENQPGLVWIKDAESRFLAVNLAFARSCGKSATEDLVGKTDFDIWPKDLAERYREDDFSVMEGGRPIMVEEPILHEGESRWFETFKTPVLSGKNKVLGTTGYARDITERKRAEERILESNRQLTEAMIRADRLARAAQAANEAKSDFLANMSHELRTPLNAVLALSEALIEQVRGPLNERQMASVKNIEASGRHLLDLINDILDLAKVESGQMNIQRQWIPVSEVCEACLIFVREAAAAKDLSLDFHLDDPKIQIHADPKHLRQMLVNLLINAVKFTPAGGEIGLSVSVQTDRQAISFTVQDSGIGIAAEDMNRLFKPFSQLDSSLSRHHEGSGLGLVLVQRLVELHNGSVSVESEPGKGSCFTLVLPIGCPVIDGKSPEKRDVEDTVKPSAQPLSDSLTRHGTVDSSASSALKILYVDDNESNITAIGEYMQDVGFQVSIAQNGLEALEMVERIQPDIILMDIQMPKMDGLETTRRLRRLPVCSDIPVIALTALAMPGDRERSLEAGANEYITKPVHLKELIATIHRLISKGKHSNETTKQYNPDRG